MRRELAAEAAGPSRAEGIVEGPSIASATVGIVHNDRRVPSADERKRAEETPEGEEIRWAPNTGLPLALKVEGGSIPGQLPGTTWKADPTKQMRFELQKNLEQLATVPSVESRKAAKALRKQAPTTAGPKWFDLPATTITPDMKQELRLLKLRTVLDPKRHYRAPDTTKFPKHFQIGTVVEGPADFYSGRLSKKERKQSFGAELLADPGLKQYRKRKYEEIQQQKQSGGKGFWRAKKNKQKPRLAADSHQLSTGAIVSV
eukprot:SM000036S13335  [mRNA]  locus=s36:606795:609350:- [translate_table: standard]